MSVAVSLPLVIPPDARRALGTDQFAHRVGKVCRISGSHRVLDLGAGGAALVLAKDFQSKVVCAGSSEGELEALRSQVNGTTKDRVEFQKLSPPGFPFQQGEFDLVVCVEKVWMPLEKALATFRPFLRNSGHLALLYPMSVGRQPLHKEWEQVLGVPLVSPRECFQQFEKAGFEPINIDSLSDLQIASYFDAIEESLRRFPDSADAPVKAQLEQRKNHPDLSGLSFGCLIGRRREAGEAPPLARDSG
jgi:SAM-dependent methyltransferase